MNHKPLEISYLFSRRDFLTTPDDGVPDNNSPSLILLEMWIDRQEEVNTSEKHIKPSQRNAVKKAKATKSTSKNQLNVIAQNMLDVDMLLWSRTSGQANTNIQVEPGKPGAEVSKKKHYKSKKEFAYRMCTG